MGPSCSSRRNSCLNSDHRPGDSASAKVPVAERFLALGTVERCLACDADAVGTAAEPGVEWLSVAWRQVIKIGCPILRGLWNSSKASPQGNAHCYRGPVFYFAFYLQTE